MTMSMSSPSRPNLGTYRAIQLTQLSKSIPEGIHSLSLSTLPRPPLLPTQVRIRIHASSLNYFDLLLLIGRYQFKPSLPYTLGSEAAGTIIEVGEKVKGWKVGDEVIAGMTNGAGMASEMVIASSLLVPKSPVFSFAEAAAFPVGFYTSYHALAQRGHLKEGDFLLVTGAGGGMGLSAVQLGVKLGAIVIAAASSDDKLEQAKKAGAKYTINYSTQDLKSTLDQITNKKGVDVCYEVVGGKVADAIIRSMAPNGRFLVVGFASGTIPSIPANMVLVKGFDVVGVRSGAEMSRDPKLAQEMVKKMREWTHSDRALAPYLGKEVFKVEQFREAYKAIDERKVIGKAVVVWEDGADKVKVGTSKL